jgi:hypothetical protein
LGAPGFSLLLTTSSIVEPPSFPPLPSRGSISTTRYALVLSLLFTTSSIVSPPSVPSLSPLPPHFYLVDLRPQEMKRKENLGAPGFCLLFTTSSIVSPLLPFPFQSTAALSPLPPLPCSRSEEEIDLPASGLCRLPRFATYSTPSPSERVFGGGCGRWSWWRGSPSTRRCTS